MTLSLTWEQRIALLLKDLFDFSNKDMSHILEVSEDVIRSRLSRARSAPRRHFQKRCSWLDPGNPCRCRNRAGCVLDKYPALAKKLSGRTNREEYNRMVAKQPHRDIGSEAEFKARKTLEAILKNY